MTDSPRRSYPLADIDEQSRSVRVVASTKNPGLAYIERDGKQIEVWESIVGWDLERFAKAPVALWNHNTDDFPVGKARDRDTGALTAAYDADVGELSMRVFFASERANPQAERVWLNVLDRNIEAVSVSFRTKEVLKEEERDGKLYRDIRAELMELSFVSVGEDEDALTTEARSRAVLQPDGSIQEPEPDEDPEEKRRKELSAAAKALAAGRRKRADAEDEVVRLDYGRLGKAQRTGSGGVRIPARFTRTGVLEYRLGNGNVRRELRLPEEVFHKDSLESLRSVPVTDHHPYQIGGLVDPSTWRDVSIGHAENPHAEGDRFIAGDIVVNDAAAIDAIERGDREDTSAGYTCRLDVSPGVWNGQQYDVIQRRIRYNHVAILPPGHGRAGKDVGLRLDANDAVCVTDTPGVSIMKVIKLDGKEFEYGSEAHIEKLESMHLADLEKHESAVKELTAKLDETRGRLDAVTKEVDEEKAKRAAEKEAKAKKEAEEEEERKQRIKRRVRLFLRAAKMMEEEDEEKTDSLLDLSDRDLMVEAIKRTDADFSGEGESDDYVRARFDMLEKSMVRADSVDAVVNHIERSKRAGSIDDVEKARQSMLERNRNAWKGSAAK